MLAGISNLAKLPVRVEAAIQYLLKTQPPEAKQSLRFVKSVLTEKDGLFSVATLHEYVHNPQWKPVPKHLREYWDNTSEFIRLLWS